MLGWGIGLDPDQFDVWHSSKTRPDDSTTSSYANAEVDELLEHGPVVLRAGVSARAAYDRLQEILADEQPRRVPLLPRRAAAVASRVRGVELGARPASGTTSTSGSCPQAGYSGTPSG